MTLIFYMTVCSVLKEWIKYNKSTRFYIDAFNDNYCNYQDVVLISKNKINEIRGQ